MIPLYDANGERLGITYRALTINNPNDDPDEGYFPEMVISSYRLDAVTEPLPQQDGLEAYQPRKLMRMLRMDGFVKAKTKGILFDKMDTLNAAYDPVLAWDEDTADFDRGYLELDYSQPTALAYAGGVIPMRVYARTLRLPVDAVTKGVGFQAQFRIEMQMADPRRYLQTTSTLALASGANNYNNTLASYPSWFLLTLLMAGAGSASWTVQGRDASEALTLDLSSLIDNDILEVDMEHARITKNGVYSMTTYVSGGFFQMYPGTNAMDITNKTNIDNADITWRRAFV